MEARTGRHKIYPQKGQAPDSKAHLIERLVASIEIDRETGCWNWIKALGTTGYGTTAVNGKNIATHRLSYETFIGPIEEGKFILHTCDNRTCINPNHLFQGTHTDNMRDMHNKLRGRRILSPSDVAEIRRSTETYSVIAKRFGVSIRTVEWTRQKLKDGSYASHKNWDVPTETEEHTECGEGEHEAWEASGT